MRSLFHYFTRGEWLLLGCSVAGILLAFCLFDRANYVTLIASLLGATSLIFVAKGNPVGQVLMIAFSLLYGWISLGCAYYGEMITYLGMTLPMAAACLVSWLRHPFQGHHSEVQVNHVSRKEFLLLIPLTLAVTAVFCLLLWWLDTANLAVSTVSVATSFAAAYLTFRRSPYFALGYALNDAVLIVLWILAALEDRSYISVVVCFIAFLANDLYGFLNWRRMAHRQKQVDVCK